MSTVFADASYWIALIKEDDSWAGPAKKARDRLGVVVLVTTDEVLSEVLTVLGRRRNNKPSLEDLETLRRKVVQMIRAIMGAHDVKVVPQSRESFLNGVHRYYQGAKTEYSLSDCISMNTMDAESITEVLTTDRHFRDEGFDVLIARE